MRRGQARVKGHTLRQQTRPKQQQQRWKHGLEFVKRRLTSLHEICTMQPPVLHAEMPRLLLYGQLPAIRGEAFGQGTPEVEGEGENEGEG